MTRIIINQPWYSESEVGDFIRLSTPETRWWMKLGYTLTGRTAPMRIKAYKVVRVVHRAKVVENNIYEVEDAKE